MNWQVLPLSKVLINAKSGFACGEDCADGVFQFRMNNITVEGNLNLSKMRRVPESSRNLGTFLVQPGDVLFNATNSPELVGKTAFFSGYNEPAVFSNHFLRLRPDSKSLDGRFLARWLQLQFQRRVFQGMCRQWVNQATVGRDALLALSVPLPSLEEQRRIAEVLDRAEELRSKRREAIAQLDTLTQAIFREMFGNPVTNPKGWEIELFSSQIKSVRYGTGSPPDYVVEGIPFIRATNVKEGTIKSKDIKRISLGEATKLAKCKVSFGDLIVVRSGVNTGDCAMVSREYHGAYAAFDLIVELPLINSVFYNFLINSSYGKSYLAPLTRRAAQAHLNAEQLRNLKFISPPMSLKEEFAQRIEAVEKLKASHCASLSELDALFASLQHRAFRGEL